MPPVIANGGYYGAPGVTAADMLYSLRNQGWSDQQIMDVYGTNDPMVRIMQLENRWNQTQPGANGYRYQFPQRQQRGPSMNTMRTTAQDVANMVPTGPSMDDMTAAAQSAVDAVPKPTYTPYGPALPIEQALEVSRQNLARATPATYFGNSYDAVRGYFGNLYDAVRGYFGF